MPDEIIEAIERRKKNSHFTIIAVAEGAISKEDAKLSKKEYAKKLKEIVGLLHPGLVLLETTKQM